MDPQLYRAVGHQTLIRLLLVLPAVLPLEISISSVPMAADEHLGIIEYEVACLPCHGVEGRGDGAMVKSLSTSPSDLTRIAKSNSGRFPVGRITEIVDGRAIVAAHGGRVMPVREHRYRQATVSAERSSEMELRARRQINALVRYLETMQEP